MKLVECRYCKKQRAIQNTTDWQMQCLHIYNDLDKYLEYLTCEECKKISPYKYLEKLEKENEKIKISP